MGTLDRTKQISASFAEITYGVYDSYVFSFCIACSTRTNAPWSGSNRVNLTRGWYDLLSGNSLATSDQVVNRWFPSNTQNIFSFRTRKSSTISHSLKLLVQLFPCLVPVITEVLHTCGRPLFICHAYVERCMILNISTLDELFLHFLHVFLLERTNSLHCQQSAQRYV